MGREKSDKKRPRDASDSSNSPRKVKKQQLSIDQETFKRILEVVGKNIATIEYLHMGIDGRMPDDVVQEVVKLLDYAKFLVTLRGNPWILGDTILSMNAETDFDYYQIYLAHGAATKLQIKDITLDCAISDESNFIRGYSSGGNALDTETVDSLDKLFNAWLASMKFQGQDGAVYNLISKDGSIYKATKAKLWLDNQGEPVPVEPDEFRAALDRKKGGLEEFIHKKNKIVEHITIQQHDYPQEQAVPNAPD